ncbi:MAG: hypothetical protein M5U08_18100 [Burkholderiales bacterium]|nr:hypothetical protein [Burkholderiales bacterium]
MPRSCGFLAPLPARRVFERLDERGAHAAALGALGCRHHLEQECRRRAAELAVQSPGEHEARKPARPFHREVHVQRRLLERRLQAALVVRAARAAHHRLVDGDHRLEVSRRELAHRGRTGRRRAPGAAARRDARRLGAAGRARRGAADRRDALAAGTGARRLRDLAFARVEPLLGALATVASSTRIVTLPAGSVAPRRASSNLVP